jgi:hypothetical protein
VASEDKLDILLLAENVEDFQNDAAGKTEYGFDPFVPQRFAENFGAGLFH